MTVSWRTLYRLWDVERLDYHFISVDNGDEREAFLLADNAPVVKLARVYYDTLENCMKMQPEAFVQYRDKWEARRGELTARDPARADAFFSALTAAYERHRKHALLTEDATFHYLFDKQEKP